MINTYDVKASMRKSEIIFDSLNRLNTSKQTGGLKDTELSNLIVCIGDVFANKIKQGKVTVEEIESAESYLTGFIGENKDKYFSYPHRDLDRAAKSFFEGNDFAKEELEQRNQYAQPVMDAESYERTFKKLG